MDGRAQGNSGEYLDLSLGHFFGPGQLSFQLSPYTYHGDFSSGFGARVEVTVIIPRPFGIVVIVSINKGACHVSRLCR